MMDPKKLATTEYYQHRFRNFSTMIIMPSTILFLGLLLFLIFARRLNCHGCLYRFNFGSCQHSYLAPSKDQKQ